MKRENHYLVWVAHNEGDRWVGTYNTLVMAMRHCKRLYRGYVTSTQSWARLFSVGMK